MDPLRAHVAWSTYRWLGEYQSDSVTPFAVHHSQ